MKNKRLKGIWKKFQLWFKKVEFSKLFSGLVAFACVIGAFASTIRYFNLVEYALNINAATLPEPTLSVAYVSVLLCDILTYCLYQFGSKNSRNKFGIDEHGVPYKERAKEYLLEARKEMGLNGNFYDSEKGPDDNGDEIG